MLAEIIILVLDIISNQ